MDFNWLWVIPVLGVLIIIHEMGHFFAARWLGIKVEEFGIGFPPRIFAVRRNGIDYSLNLLPIGGFVKILGENGESDDPASFGRAPAWKRIIVLAAGSFMNLVLALLIFMGMSISGTSEIDAPQTVVAEVREKDPAQVAGMQVGDRIVRAASQLVTSSDQLRAISRENAGKATEYVVERDGTTQSLTVTPKVDPPDGAYLGISLGYWVAPAKVDVVTPGGVAEKAGLRSGDVIREIHGTLVDNTVEATYLLNQSKGSAQVVVERNGQRLPEPVALDIGTNQGRYGFGLYYPIRMVYYNPLQAMGRALDSTWRVISSIPRGIAEALAGRAQGPGVAGPVGIGQLTGEVAQDSGINGLLGLTALLGISLFMINLLPLPALDGGRLLFVFIELLRGGRRIAPEKEGLVHFAGMMLLLTLLAIITIFDVQRLFEGTRLLP